jgi:bacterioferritin-associated ferredoxin
MDRERLTIICRCNDITLEEVLKAIDEGVDDFELLRKRLRIGFGPCQGRGCLMIAARVYAKRAGKRLEEVLAELKFRPPVVPIPSKYFLPLGE